MVASFEEINKARKLFGLGEFASLDEIKQAYRNKAFLHHPGRSDSKNAEGDEMMKSFNQAYELLLEYRSQYKYSFREDDIDRAFPDEAYVRRYVYGWFEGM